MRKTLPAAVTAAVGLAVRAPLSAAAAEHEDGASLSVLHGVPDLTVDVYVDGELTLDDFAPGELAGPLELPAGDYEVAITAADAEDDAAPVLGPVELTLAEGGDYTAAAHLDADGAPTVTAFENDTDALAAGEGRLTVRHIAAAPAVDVWAGEEVVVPGLENPDEASLEIPAGTVIAAIGPRTAKDARRARHAEWPCTARQGQGSDDRQGRWRPARERRGRGTEQPER